MSKTLVGLVRKSPLHGPDMSVYKTEKAIEIRCNKYDPQFFSLRFDKRLVPQLIELLKESVEEKFKNADRDYLKNMQHILGKEEGLKQYNECMERERKHDE